MKTKDGAATTAVQIPSWKQRRNQSKQVEKAREILFKAEDRAHASKKNFDEWNEINNGDKDALWWIYLYELSFDAFLFQKVRDIYLSHLTLWIEMVELQGLYATGKINGIVVVDEEDDDDDWDDEDF